ncbi:MAG: hypothetical protein KBF68_05490, partial [Nitrosomonas sp.]|nr:hypothetical protein [Nitrosomonas sp.]
MANPWLTASLAGKLKKLLSSVYNFPFHFFFAQTKCRNLNHRLYNHSLLFSVGGVFSCTVKS